MVIAAPTDFHPELNGLCVAAVCSAAAFAAVRMVWPDWVKSTVDS